MESKEEKTDFEADMAEKDLNDFIKELRLLKAYVMRGEDYSEKEFDEKYPKVAAMTQTETEQ